MKELDDLRAVLDITRAMAAERDIDRLLRLITESASRIMNADRTSIFILDRGANELWSRVAQGSEISEIRFPAASGIAGHVATTAETLNIPDAYDDPRFNREIDRKTGYRTRQILCMPLTGVSGEVVGVIQILNKLDGETFAAYDEGLLGTLAAQAGVILQQATLMQAYVERERMARELSIARTIQQSMLPSKAPSLDPFELHGFCRPASETGGDYFDYVEGGGGGVTVVVADVCGHGLGAALKMVEVRSLVRAFGGEAAGPGKLLAKVDSVLSEGEGVDFTSMVAVELDRARPRARYASAGHEGPLVLRAGGPAEEHPSTGPLLGLGTGLDFGEEELALGGGDLLAVFTDGVWEAASAEDEAFGKERLAGQLRDAGPPLRPAVDGVWEALQAFTGRPEMEDDVTLVVARAKEMEDS